ncbi:MAG: hypothetical protein K2Y20_05420 [Sphingomonas sp.]|nr:hypothetical protein [Sphingomonas sp.]
MKRRHGTLADIRAKIERLEALGQLNPAQATELRRLNWAEACRKFQLRARVKTYRAKAAAAEAELNGRTIP